MANPNIVDVSMIRGKTSVRNFIRTTTSPIISNNSSSNEILKVNSLLATNKSDIHQNVSVQYVTSNGSFSLITGMVIPPKTTVNLLQKETSIYLEENTSLNAFCSSANTVGLICSYEQISNTLVSDRNDREPVDEQIFDTVGTFTWIVPTGVTSVGAICVGGGGGSGTNDNRNGGGGGELSWTNSISVTPGESLTINVGNGAPSGAVRGGNTSILRGGTTLISAVGGVSATTGVAGIGGAGGVKQGGGNGGNGGSTDGSNGAGGGGAGGYTGNGGKGSDAATLNSTGGSGGGGGGGGYGRVGEGDGGAGYGGGGVGLLGPGDSGLAGGARQGGFGGSLGANGTKPNGGLYGGGTGGNGNGGSGAVRIIWGTAGTEVISTQPTGIVTANLRLSFDAANTSSYFGSGNALVDLSGNGYVGRLSNGAFGNTANSGVIIFDGVDDYIAITEPSGIGGTGNIVGSGTSPFTVEIWFFNTRTLATGAYTMLFRVKQDTEFFGVLYNPSGTYNFYPVFRNFTQWGTPVTNSDFINKWICAHFVYAGGDKGTAASFKTYVNGNQIPTATNNFGTAGGATSNCNIIGADGSSGCNVTAGYHGGRISIYRLYNRELNSTEVQQNFNAIRARYGL